MIDLQNYRLQIDNIDEQILFLIKNRINVTNLVAEYKKKNNLPIFQPEREKEKIQKIREIASRLDLEEEFAATLIQLLIENSKKNQKKIFQTHHGKD